MLPPILASLACNPAPAPESPAQHVARNETAPPVNVILVSIDTLRADHLGLYGYGRPVSPGIDAMGAESIVFDRAVAQAPWTLQSHASLFTGLYPSRHLAGVGQRAAIELPERLRKTMGLPDDRTTLAEVLHGVGYKTSAVVSSGMMSKQFGLAQGFDDWVELTPEHHGTDIEPIAEAAFRALHDALATRDRPFFLFLHTYEVHAPYLDHEIGEQWSPGYRDGLVKTGAPPADFGITVEHDAKLPFARRLTLAHAPSVADATEVIARYDSEISRMDALLLQPLVQRLKEAGAWDDTLVILTSDHGEALGERNHWVHYEGLYDEYLHVPMMIKPPAHAALAPRRIAGNAAAASIDVLPTVLALAGVSHDLAVDGVDLGPVLGGAQSDPDRVVLSESPNSLSAQNAHVKLLYHKPVGTWEAYVDPDDLRDVVARDGGLPREAVGVAEAAVAFMRDHPSRWNDDAYDPVAQGNLAEITADADQPLSPEMLAGLEALGYVD